MKALLAVLLVTSFSAGAKDKYSSQEVKEVTLVGEEKSAARDLFELLASAKSLHAESAEWIFYFDGAIEASHSKAKNDPLPFPYHATLTIDSGRSSMRVDRGNGTYRTLLLTGLIARQLRDSLDRAGVPTQDGPEGSSHIMKKRGSIQCEWKLDDEESAPAPECMIDFSSAE